MRVVFSCRVPSSAPVCIHSVCLMFSFSLAQTMFFLNHIKNFNHSRYRKHTLYIFLFEIWPFKKGVNLCISLAWGWPGLTRTCKTETVCMCEPDGASIIPTVTLCHHNTRGPGINTGAAPGRSLWALSKSTAAFIVRFVPAENEKKFPIWINRLVYPQYKYPADTSLLSVNFILFQKLDFHLLSYVISFLLT